MFAAFAATVWAPAIAGLAWCLDQRSLRCGSRPRARLAAILLFAGAWVVLFSVIGSQADPFEELIWSPEPSRSFSVAVTPHSGPSVEMQYLALSLFLLALPVALLLVITTVRAYSSKERAQHRWLFPALSLASLVLGGRCLLAYDQLPLG